MEKYVFLFLWHPDKNEWVIKKVGHVMGWGQVKLSKEGDRASDDVK